jgi:hypothetical protein
MAEFRQVIPLFVLVCCFRCRNFLPFACDRSFAESQYEALSNAAKFISILGFFSVIGAWQIISMRDRRRRSVEGM